MTDIIQARAGQIIGRDHMARRVNCHDSTALIQTENYLAGVVCDGCGDGAHSEVGAKLAAQFIVTQIRDLLGKGIPAGEIPARLYPRIIAYLAQIVDASNPLNPVAFIRDYLLFTIVGVVQSGEDTLIFAAGDGTFVVDDMICQRDQDNAPAYVAYHLLDPAALGEFALPVGFDIHQCDPAWQRIAVMTDGFDTDLIPELWGHKHQRGLQRKLNVWSDRDRRFRDDATVIAIERTTSR